MLTNAQLQTLKADIAADPALNAIPSTSDGFFAIAAAYNALASPDFFVWATNVPVQNIFDEIVWANMTPTFNPQSDTSASWTNRSLACQGKQFNLQTMLMGQQTINGAKAKTRNGLQDALTDLPSGNNGNARQAGWAAVQVALTRKGTRGEKLFANVSAGDGGLNTTPATMVFEGVIAPQDIEAARNS